jgi:hypothetical protein
MNNPWLWTVAALLPLVALAAFRLLRPPGGAEQPLGDDDALSPAEMALRWCAPFPAGRCCFAAVAPADGAAQTAWPPNGLAALTVDYVVCNPRRQAGLRLRARRRARRRQPGRAGRARKAPRAENRRRAPDPAAICRRPTNFGASARRRPVARRRARPPHAGAWGRAAARCRRTMTVTDLMGLHPVVMPPGAADPLRRRRPLASWPAAASR